jgi:hypothetical protein
MNGTLTADHSIGRPSDLDKATAAMSTILNIFLNLLLIGSMLGFIGLALVAALKAQTARERFVRFGALFAGAMIVVGAQAAGVTYTQFIVDSLSSTQPTNVATKVAWAVIPGGLGGGLGYYLTNRARTSENVATRILILAGMLATAQFAQIYTFAFGERGLDIGPAAIPNLSFVVGLVLWFVFHDGNLPAGAKRRFRKGKQTQVTQGPQQPDSGPGSFVRPPTDA